MGGADPMRRAIWYWVFAGVLVVGFCFGCRDESPVKIGLLTSTSGRVADSGISGYDAAQLAVEQCNQAGGISGRKVQLLVRDDRGEPEAGRRALRELLAAGVTAVIGPMTSDMALAVTPIANEVKVLLMSPTATTEALSGQKDYFFRVASTTRTYATKTADFIINSRHKHRIAVIYDLNNRSFALNWIENFKQRLTALRGELITTAGFSAQGEVTFLEIVEKVLTTGPDGIVIVANSMDSALFCQQIRKRDASVEITLSDWGATERLLELGGKAVEGVTVVQAFDRRSQNQRYQAFRKIYTERYHREPGFPGVNTYDAAQVILAALNAQKGDQSLCDTVLGMKTFEGLQSNFSFDPFGDARRPLVSISIVQNRQFVVLE